MKKGQGFARRITKKTLEKYLPLLQAKKEIDEQEESKGEKEKSKQNGDSALSKIEAEFGGESIQISTPYTAPEIMPPKKKKKAPSKPSKKPPTGVKGPIVWIKPKLFASDVQRQQGNVTGGVRLTQARYEHQGQLIDKTTYFRDEIFGQQTWEKTGLKLDREKASIKFDITILGKSYGIHILTVRHNAHGEAGQGNYTTQLTWTPLGDLIRDLNLIGKKFTLYAPSKGTTEPFFVEIS